MKRVIVESPYSGDVKKNEVYAEFVLNDCLVNYNESPYASHLLYTRKYVLDDRKTEERKLGILAGFCWRDVSTKTVFYIDLGMSNGMEQGVEDCKLKGNEYEVRKLPPYLMDKFKKVCKEQGFDV